MLTLTSTWDSSSGRLATCRVEEGGPRFLVSFAAFAWFLREARSGNRTRGVRRFLWWIFHLSNFHTLPSCSPGHAISKTVSWASVALFLPVVASFERYNKEFNGKRASNKNNSKNTLSDGFFLLIRDPFTKVISIYCKVVSEHGFC